MHANRIYLLYTPGMYNVDTGVINEFDRLYTRKCNATIS